jgi:chemotaxis family two-component system response regulator Rcp1
MLDLTVEARGRPAELLLIEDNYGDVLLTSEAFRGAKLSNNLAVAGDGEQALAMLQRKGAYAEQPTPDLILLDLNLPRMDGREVLQAIKGDPDLQRIPVIVLTSSKADIDILKSYELRANGYIVKPVTFERLQEIVASIESFWFSVVVLAPSPACELARVA